MVKVLKTDQSEKNFVMELSSQKRGYAILGEISEDQAVLHDNNAELGDVVSVPDKPEMVFIVDRIGKKTNGFALRSSLTILKLWCATRNIDTVIVPASFFIGADFTVQTFGCIIKELFCETEMNFILCVPAKGDIDYSEVEKSLKKKKKDKKKDKKKKKK